MQAIPWSTIALGSLLLISARSKGGQEVQSPQPEKSKPPVKMEQRGRILGIGGVFFKSANRDQMREWYSKHLGLADKGGGVMLRWREHDDPQKEHVTVWTVFPEARRTTTPFRAEIVRGDHSGDNLSPPSLLEDLTRMLKLWPSSIVQFRRARSRTAAPSQRVTGHAHGEFFVLGLDRTGILWSDNHLL